MTIKDSFLEGVGETLVSMFDIRLSQYPFGRGISVELCMRTMPRMADGRVAIHVLVDYHEGLPLEWFIEDAAARVGRLLAPFRHCATPEEVYATFLLTKDMAHD